MTSTEDIKMKVAAIFLLLSLVVASSAAKWEIDSLWQQFKEKHGKVYETAEDESRMRIFVQNIAYITRHNLAAELGIHSFRLGVNRFADMTNDEYRRTLPLGFTPMSHATPYKSYSSDSDLPSSINWIEKGLVTPIKNQGQCGSCWAFSTIAALEGQHAKATGKLIGLSEQQLLDCAREKYGNGGCQKGGDMRPAFQYIKDNEGIETDKDYPYTAVQGDCKYDKSKRAAGVTGYVNITQGDEKALQDAVAKIGPISVGIDAGSILFQFYSGGVYNDPFFCHSEMEKLNHGVAVVGYGNEGGADYWLVKNSWGTVWGDKGLIKMSRGKNNQCGIATYATYPTVK